MSGVKWRIGRSYGLHVYEVGPTSPEGDRPVATFHRTEDAQRAVDAVNGGQSEPPGGPWSGLAARRPAHGVGGALGVCDLCRQEMIRTADDCWHPWNVAVACPPELKTPTLGVPYPAFGDGFGRPGREHWRPA